MTNNYIPDVAPVVRGRWHSRIYFREATADMGYILILGMEIPKKYLSTDIKPLNVPNGTCIKEDDTKDVYIYMADEKMWVKIASCYETEKEGEK